ncbi:SsrA-binding protein SmpB [Alteromonas sp. a30]|uniref:SsrA-binding protein SmpB n=1 Tax=Alteromonas sp. a30 TaxID=2730917 RepID=UPI002282D0BE|nr:SsrA-binding protein SmpB [Alteromonas sp. a30]MCY7295806.1 SsrA-binding protein SmpB [Alteromonas sp. a30]
MSKKKQNKTSSNTIALNKKAKHDFFLEDKFEAGMELQGWEIKSIRQGKVNLSDSHVFIKEGEAFVTNCKIQPLESASSHVICDPNRTKKLLLHKRELDKLIGSVERQSYTITATAMYWKKCWVKLEIYLAKGKQSHDKRDTIKDRDWERQKSRVMKNAR